MTNTEELLRGSMLDEETILADLRDLSVYYDDMQMDSRVVPAMETAALPSLVAMLEADDQDRSRILTHSFLPLDREEAEFTKYLQYYAELPNSLAGIDRAELLEAVCALNALLPIGACSLVEPREELGLPLMAALRVVQGFPLRQKIDQGVFTEGVFLFDTSCEIVSTVLDALAAGKTTKEALCALNQE